MSKLAVITGSGSGVGQAVVFMLAERGWDVALVGTRKQTLEETIRLVKQPKSKLMAFPCDVADAKAVHEMAESVRNSLGNPEVLVNSAGTNAPKRSLGEVSSDDYKRIVDVNLNGAFYCTREFLGAMRSAGRGTIVNIASDAGLRANPKAGSAYVSSKFGLRGLTQTINVEERRNGIRACGIFPGEINTPILDKRPAPPPQDYREKILQADDVARCVLLAIELPDRAIIEELLVRPANAATSV
jgi:NAD(P)-dependent dehydrogenase (short-subunit alcohol dehydrogenase family)